MTFDIEKIGKIVDHHIGTYNSGIGYENILSYFKFTFSNSNYNISTNNKIALVQILKVHS